MEILVTSGWYLKELTTIYQHLLVQKLMLIRMIWLRVSKVVEQICV
nr:MAG TPA: hypothetical protein [Crassvirales sp.]